MASVAQRMYCGHIPPFRIPEGQTRFEMFAKALGVSARHWEGSVKLRIWAKHNKNRYYVPEELLSKWGLKVKFEVTEWSERKIGAGF